jgi:hypothetical protein
MTAKEWLSRARTIDRELTALYEAREMMIAQMTKATQGFTADPVQSSKDPHKFDRLGELAYDIDQRTRELDRVKAEILRAINRVPDGLCRIVLIERYLNMKSFERVAVDNYISIRNVWRIHGRALGMVEKILA